MIYRIKWVIAKLLWFAHLGLAYAMYQLVLDGHEDLGLQLMGVATFVYAVAQIQKALLKGRPPRKKLKIPKHSPASIPSAPQEAPKAPAERPLAPIPMAEAALPLTQPHSASMSAKLREFVEDGDRAIRQQVSTPQPVPSYQQRPRPSAVKAKPVDDQKSSDDWKKRVPPRKATPRHKPPAGEPF